MRIEPATIARTLIECRNVTEAAKALGISRATLYSYKRSPEVRELLDVLARDAVQAAASELSIKHSEVIRDLEGLAHDEKIPPIVRLNALRTILEETHKTIELSSFDERLARIEERIRNA